MKSVCGIVYDAFSLQSLALKQTSISLKEPGGYLCKWLAVPINPSDLNQIEGTYPRKPTSLPAYGGNEGVAEIVQILGGPVAERQLEPELQIGDWVIPKRSALGTWRDWAIYQASDLFPIPKDQIPVEYAACLLVNPSTAFRLIRDFYNWASNGHDWLIQNAATSMVGQCVIQLCKHWGIPNVAVIRAQESVQAEQQLKDQLLSLGATVVVVEERLEQEVQQRPMLALNAVGGACASSMLKVMGTGATFVTYGAMAKRPVTVSASMLIFQDIRIVGFWMTRWYEEHPVGERSDMVKQLIELMRQGKLVLKTRSVPFEASSVELKNHSPLKEKHLMYPNGP